MVGGPHPTRPLTAEEASQGVKLLKPALLAGLVDSLAMEQCLIFCRTNVDCDSLEAYLTALGGGQRWRPGMEKGKENAYSAVVLAGMRSMDERRRNLDAFREGTVRFLICTDVAARGLDIKELPYVINMTLPDEKETETYIHRIGRVGRADRVGLAISLVSTVREKVWYHSNCSDRGKGCTNTKPVAEGGCTIQFNEPASLLAVQRRLQLAGPLPEMEVTVGEGGKYTFTLPASVAALGAVYGGEKHETAGPNVHVDSIRGAVRSLAALEVRAQSVFLAIQAKYARPAA